MGGGGTVYIGVGTWDQGSTSLTLPNTGDIRLIGQGRRATTLHYSGSGAAIVNGDTSTDRRYATIEQLNIDLRDASAGASAIELNNMRYSTIRQVRIDATGTTANGIKMSGGLYAYYNRFEQVEISTNGNAIYFTGTQAINTNWFENIVAFGNASTAKFLMADVSTATCGANVFINCAAEGTFNSTHFMDLATGSGIWYQNQFLNMMQLTTPTTTTLNFPTGSGYNYVIGGDVQVSIANLSDRNSVISYGLLQSGAPSTAFFGQGSNGGINFPTVSGSRGGNAALASLITQLQNLGLINDGTSA